MYFFVFRVLRRSVCFGVVLVSRLAFWEFMLLGQNVDVVTIPTSVTPYLQHLQPGNMYCLLNIENGMQTG